MKDDKTPIQDPQDPGKPDADNFRRGWISLYRSVKDNFLYPKNRPLSNYEAWIEILFTVNHTPKDVQIGYEVVNCERGESVQSLETWGRSFRWHKSKVRRYFKMLERRNMIVLKSTHKTTHLRVIQYENYQNNRNDNESIKKRSRIDPESIPTVNNNSNNSNNSNNEREGKPAQLLVLNFFKERRLPSSEGQKFIRYYDVRKWKTKDNQAFDWQVQAENWIGRIGDYNGTKDPPGAKKFQPWEKRKVVITDKGYPLEPNITWSQKMYIDNPELHSQALEFWKSKGHMLKTNSFGSLLWFNIAPRKPSDV